MVILLLTAKSRDAKAAAANNKIIEEVALLILC
jgi:hypothetical protein